MSDASTTTQCRKQRTLFADRTIQQAMFDNGLKKHDKNEWIQKLI